jgi:hypothetical protein
VHGTGSARSSLTSLDVHGSIGVRYLKPFGDFRVGLLIQDGLQKHVFEFLQPIPWIRQKTVAQLGSPWGLLQPVERVVQVSTPSHQCLKLGECQALEDPLKPFLAVPHEGVAQLHDLAHPNGMSIHLDNAVVMVPEESRKAGGFIGQCGEEVDGFSQGVVLCGKSLTQIVFQKIVVRSVEGLVSEIAGVSCDSPYHAVSVIFPLLPSFVDPDALQKVQHLAEVGRGVVDRHESSPFLQKEQHQKPQQWTRHFLFGDFRAVGSQQGESQSVDTVVEVVVGM